MSYLFILNNGIGSSLSIYQESHVSLAKQVTRSKVSLDKALKLTRRLKKETTNLRDYAAGVLAELFTREGTKAPRDIEDEMQWIKVAKNCRAGYIGSLVNLHINHLNLVLLLK